jgi:hypothetical protein
VPQDLVAQLEDFVETTTYRNGRRIFRNISKAVTEALAIFLEKHKAATNNGVSGRHRKN